MSMLLFTDRIETLHACSQSELDQGRERQDDQKRLELQTSSRCQKANHDRNQTKLPLTIESIQLFIFRDPRNPNNASQMLRLAVKQKVKHVQ